MIDSSRGGKGASHKSGEETLKWRSFERTVKRAREGFASLSTSELRDIIETAILSVRKQKRRRFVAARENER